MSNSPAIPFAAKPDEFYYANALVKIRRAGISLFCAQCQKVILFPDACVAVRMDSAPLICRECFAEPSSPEEEEEEMEPMEESDSLGDLMPRPDVTLRGAVYDVLLEGNNRRMLTGEVFRRVQTKISKKNNETQQMFAQRLTTTLCRMGRDGILDRVDQQGRPIGSHRRAFYQIAKKREGVIVRDSL